MILAFGAHTWLDNSYSSALYPFFLSPPLSFPTLFSHCPLGQHPQLAIDLWLSTSCLSVLSCPNSLECEYWAKAIQWEY